MPDLGAVTGLLATQGYLQISSVLALTADYSIPSGVRSVAYSNAGAVEEVTLSLANLSLLPLGATVFFFKVPGTPDVLLKPFGSNRIEGLPEGISLRLFDGVIALQYRESGLWRILFSSASTLQDKFKGPDQASGRKIYWSLYGSDSNLGLTSGGAKATLKGIRAIARPGDTVIIEPGIYPDVPDNEFTLENLPRGSEWNRIRFYCNIPFGARFKKFSLQYESYAHVEKYQWALDFDGLLWDEVGGKEIKGHDLRFFRCAFVKGQTSGNQSTLIIGGPADGLHRGAKDVLLEECVAFGSGGRYKILVYNAEGVVLRRCLTRWDAGWVNDASEWPASDITIYDSSKVEAQNCISIDSISPPDPYADTYLGSLRVEANYQETEDVFIRASIVVNNEGAAFTVNGLGSVSAEIPEASYSGYGGTAGAVVRKMRPRRVLLEDSAFFNVGGASSKLDAVTVFTGDDVRIRNNTVVKLKSASGRAYYVSDDRRSNAGTVLDNNVSVRDGVDHVHSLVDSSSIERNLRSYASIAAAEADGLLHLPSPSMTGALTATHRAGASILKRIGVSGSRYGEPGCRAMTDDDLWPFPNEGSIKALLNEYETPRGWSASSQTLTEYLWSLLGNDGPAGYAPNFVAFDGANDWLSRGGALTGVTTADRWTFFAHFRLGAIGSARMLFEINSLRVLVYISAAGHLFVFSNSAGSGMGSPVQLTTTPLVAGTDYSLHIALRWAAGGENLVAFLNGDALSFTLPYIAGSAAAFNHGGSDTFIGKANPAWGPSPFLGSLGVLWFGLGLTDTWYITDPTKFVVDGKPIYLGAAGELPSGSSPAVCFGQTQKAVNYNAGTNLGTGGNFTMNLESV